MLGIGALSSPMWVSSTPISSSQWNSTSPISCFPKRISNPVVFLNKTHDFSLLPTIAPHRFNRTQIHFSPNISSSVGSAEYTEEPVTNVKFQRSLSLPGCSGQLSLLGTGFREKVFAVIGVKVYAAALYVNESILGELNAWKGRSAAEIQKESTLFSSIFQAALEKSLQIVLVRDIDGKTFWDALDEAISPRIKAPTPVDSSALSMIRKLFQGRPLKKGTFIFLTWLDPSKMLVCISSNGLPSSVDATIESTNVTSALYDVFFGQPPVSPTLKASVANGLATFLK